MPISICDPAGTPPRLAPVKLHWRTARSAAASKAGESGAATVTETISPAGESATRSTTVPLRPDASSSSG